MRLREAIGQAENEFIYLCSSNINAETGGYLSRKALRDLIDAARKWQRARRLLAAMDSRLAVNLRWKAYDGDWWADRDDLLKGGAR